MNAFDQYEVWFVTGAYVYYVTAAYRNEKGKPTNERVSIGRLDEETGKLIRTGTTMRPI